jgi:hypothetical protein
MNGPMVCIILHIESDSETFLYHWSSDDTCHLEAIRFSPPIGQDILILEFILHLFN